MNCITRLIFVPLLLSGIPYQPLQAQDPTTSQQSPSPSRSLGVQGQPYSATRVTTSVQRRADGTTVTHQNISKIARDSQGRTRQESVPSSEAEPTQVAVMDPVASTWTMWRSESTQALVVGVATHSDEQFSEHDLHNFPKEFNVHRESVGGKMMHNIYAEGVRVTVTRPSTGNTGDRVLMTIETWTSPQLRLVLLQITDDPRVGTTTEEITQLDRSEPDPSLFRVPPGYTVIDKRATKPQ